MDKNPRNNISQTPGPDLKRRKSQLRLAPLAFHGSCQPGPFLPYPGVRGSQLIAGPSSGHRGWELGEDAVRQPEAAGWAPMKSRQG